MATDYNVACMEMGTMEMYICWYVINKWILFWVCVKYETCNELVYNIVVNTYLVNRARNSHLLN